jgi:hypothetical protein
MIGSMAFLRLRCETAYFTGAIKTNLTLQELMQKFNRARMPAKLDRGTLVISYVRDTWVFTDWQPDGLGQIGWMRFTTEGDIGGFSRKLALLNVRHMFEHSRPTDVDVTDIRCITRYSYRWHGLSGPNAADTSPTIETFDEALA